MLLIFLLLSSQNQLLHIVTWKHFLINYQYLQNTGERDETIKCLNLDYKKISSNKVVLFCAWNFEKHKIGSLVATYGFKDI